MQWNPKHCISETSQMVCWKSLFVWVNLYRCVFVNIDPLVGAAKLTELIWLILKCIRLFKMCCNIFAVLVCSFLTCSHPCWLIRLEVLCLHAVMSRLSVVCIVTCTVTQTFTTYTVIYGCDFNTVLLASYRDVYWSSVLCYCYDSVVSVIWSPLSKMWNDANINFLLVCQWRCIMLSFI